MNKHTTPGSPILKASEWITSLTFEDIPEEVVRLATLQMLDIIAAIFAGSRTLFGAPVKRALERTATPGPCTFLPDGQRLSAMDAIYLHSALANTIELDNLIFMGHVGQSAVTAPLALGEMFGADSRAVLLSQVAACEVAGRMGAYFAIGPQQGHMRSYLHRVGGAVAASKIMSLDRDTTARALAIALAMPEFPLYPAAFSPDTKVLCTSAPSVEGVRAAFLAAEGIEPALDILEHPAGFRSYFTHLPTLPDVWGQLGETWSLHALSSKIYPACAYAQGPLEATFEIIEKHGVQPEDIVRALIEAPITTLTMEFLSVPHAGAGISPVNTNFSTRRSVAAALVNGGLETDFFTREIFESKKADVENLTAKIKMSHSWQQSVDLVKGLDRALSNPGEPGVFGMSQTQKTFGKFKESMGSRPLLGPGDIPRIAKLPASDRRYLLQRFWRAYRRRIPLFLKFQQRPLVSFEKDLSRFQFRQSGKVMLTLKNGQQLSAFCRIPRGFAGHENRRKDIESKFIREVSGVIGNDRAEKALQAILGLPNRPFRDIVNALS